MALSDLTDANAVFAAIKEFERSGARSLPRQVRIRESEELLPCPTKASSTTRRRSPVPPTAISTVQRLPLKSSAVVTPRWREFSRGWGSRSSGPLCSARHSCQTKLDWPIVEDGIIIHWAYRLTPFALDARLDNISSRPAPIAGAMPPFHLRRFDMVLDPALWRTRGSSKTGGIGHHQLRETWL